MARPQTPINRRVINTNNTYQQIQDGRINDLFGQLHKYVYDCVYVGRKNIRAKIGSRSEFKGIVWIAISLDPSTPGPFQHKIIVSEDNWMYHVAAVRREFKIVKIRF